MDSTVIWWHLVTVLLQPVAETFLRPEWPRQISFLCFQSQHRKFAFPQLISENNGELDVNSKILCFKILFFIVIFITPWVSFLTDTQFHQYYDLKYCASLNVSLGPKRETSLVCVASSLPSSLECWQMLFHHLITSPDLWELEILSFVGNVSSHSGSSQFFVRALILLREKYASSPQVQAWFG